MLPLKRLEGSFYIFFAISAGFMFLANDMFLPSILNIAEDFAVPVATIQLALSMWLLGSASSQLVWGPLTDRLGRRPVILLGMTIFIAATIACSLAPNRTFFLIACIFEGIGFCTVPIAGMASLHIYYRDNAKKALTAMMVSTNMLMISPLAGPFLGAYLASHFGWRGVYAIDTLLCLIGLGFVFLSFPETLSHHDKKNPVPVLHAFKEHLSNRAFVLYAFSLGFGGAILLFWLGTAPILLMKQLGESQQTYVLWQIPVFAAQLIGNTLGPFFLRFGTVHRIVVMTHRWFLWLAPIVLLAPFIGSHNMFFYGLPTVAVFFIIGIFRAAKFRFCLSLLSRNYGTGAGLLSLIQAGGMLLGSFLAVAATHGAAWLFGLYIAALMLATVASQRLGDYFREEISA